ncbi:MAG TPA: type II toxin-antitoxin system prevent-host-death family antitoxin [Chthoniobacterales bacterium]
MKVTTVNVHTAKTHLSKLLASVAKGEKVVIAKAGKPIAQLIAVSKDDRPKAGRFKGIIEVTDHALFETLPEPELSAWEGESDR